MSDAAISSRPGKPHATARRRQIVPMTNLLRRAILAALPWLAILALWYLVRVSGLVQASLVPTPLAVLTKWWSLVTEAGFLVDMYMSTQRVVLGVALGIIAAVPVGFLLGWYQPVRQFIDPLINFFRALPPIALIPLVIVYFGIGELAKVVILFYASFFAGVIVMYEGIAQISPIYLRVARTLADMAGSADIGAAHLSEALGYRGLDRATS